MSTAGKALAIAFVSLALMLVLGFLTAMAFGAASPLFIGPLVGLIALTRLAIGALRYARTPSSRRGREPYRPGYMWPTLIYAVAWPVAWVVWLVMT